MPGMSASVSSSIRVMENPSPTFSRVTFAPVWTRVGARPARESCAVSAIVKHPAWAAPISSSGLVAAWPSSNRDLNEYGPSKAPLPTLSRPLPSARLPFHSASAFRVGMEPPLALPPFPVSLFDALLDLLGRVPAINGDYLAGDERCAVGTEPDDGARDLFRPADASDRMRGLQHLPHFRRGREVAKHSRRDRPWSHGIDPNILFGVFERDRFGQPGDGVLAGGVERSRGKPDQPRNGRVVDDRTAARLQHRRNLVLERQPHALHVDVHDLVVRLFGLIRQRSQRLLDAGVVEGTIEPAESRQRPSDHRLDIALFRDVGLDEDRFAARRFDLGDDGIAFCLAASADDDLCALFGKRDCGRTANPSIAASDQGDFPRKLTHAVLHGLSFPQLSCRPGSAAGRRDLEERAPIRRHRCRSLGSTMRLGASGPRPTVPLAHLARRSTPAAQGESTSTLEGVERAHITRVLEEMNWMLGGPRGAAARLGMKRTTLQSLMKRLDRPGDGPDEARGTVGRFSEMIRPPVPIMV